jgi:hypothetical protein
MMKTLQCHKELNVRTSHAFAVQADWLYIWCWPTTSISARRKWGPSGNGGSMIDTAPVIHNDPVTVIC